jgi:epoxyqueuosine reductase
MERDFAQLAGLGWYGKNTCLIDSHAGSWFVLGFLLTDLVLAPDVPAVGGCGTCRKCVDACPTGAIAFLEGRWQVVGSRCISYLTIENRGPLPTDLEAGIGDWTFGCDVCQEVCPFNQPRPTQPLRACDTNEADFLATRQWPSLLELAQIDYADWDHLTRSSPVRRTGWEGLRRNAAINLKNQVGG